MKNRLAVIAVLAIIVGGVLALSACSDDTSKKHKHTADSYEITVAATCTKDGERTGVCKVCKKTFTEIIPALNHDWHLQSETAPTCVEDGKGIYACANCFETDERTVAALGHDGSVVIPAVPAGCSSVGFSEGKSCSRCNEIIVAPEQIPATGHEFYYEKRSNDTHAIYCENCSYSEIAECEFTETEVSPTCLDSGKLIHTCNVCGDNHEHITAAALGHLMTEQKTFYRTVDGVYKHRQTCYRCEYYEEENCTANIEKTVDPTCEKIGYTVYNCDGCGNTYNSDFADALGHDWSAYVLENNNAMPYAHTHTRHCQRDDCTAEENGVSVGTVGTVVSVRTDESCESDAFTEYTCSLATCVYARTETHTGTALGHSYGEWEYSGDNDEHHTHSHHCLRTGCEKHETEDCRMVSSNQAATCTKPEINVDVCQDCYHVDRDESPALGHKWSAWINVRYPDGTLNHTHVCTVCNLREYGSHSYETVTTPADCEHDEAIVSTCSVCGYFTSTAVTGTALGHDWHVVECGANEHSLVCNRYEVAHEITAPHDYSHSNLCAYCGYDGLTYELAVSGDYFVVKNDNGVPRASEITVAVSRPNPAFFEGAAGIQETLPVRAVGASAFSRNNAIKKVLLPSTVTAIESNAFDRCTALTSIVFYGGDPQLTRVEYGAFYGCAALADITLPSTLKTIGNIAFSDCVGLDDIVIPESVTEIGYRAFYNTGFYNSDDNWTDGALYAGLHLIRVRSAYFTDGNTEFVIKSNTLAVAEFAFDGCAYMTKVTVPVSVKTIGTDAFRDCTGLQEVVYGGSVSDWFAITFVSALSSPMYYADSMNIIGEVNPHLVLPENITSIPAGTFKGNKSLLTVTIPAKITSIGDEAFMGCVNLAYIIFEDDNVVYMGRNAFYDTAFYKDGGSWQNGVLVLGKHILATNDDFTASDYVIDGNIRTVSAGAFAGRNIENLTIGASVVWFGAGAFNSAVLKNVTFANRPSTWFAKNAGGAVRSVSANSDPVANAQLLKNYTGDWRKS
ncbi:MAG: leucine-rich repeat domain-containing protein [Clostridiales bacterium]|nr:leucine-rich repeat domain-containing protein [Clostridiales bacterium]